MQQEFNYTFPYTSEKLRSYGILWKSQMWWKMVGKKAVLVDKTEPFQKYIPAYTLAEIGMMIPTHLFLEMRIHRFLQGFYKFQMDGDNLSKPFPTEVECRAHYLLYLLDTKKAQIEDSSEPEKLIKTPKSKPSL